MHMCYSYLISLASHHFFLPFTYFSSRTIWHELCLIKMVEEPQNGETMKHMKLSFDTEIQNLT